MQLLNLLLRRGWYPPRDGEFILSVTPFLADTAIIVTNYAVYKVEGRHDGRDFLVHFVTAI